MKAVSNSGLIELKPQMKMMIENKIIKVSDIIREKLDIINYLQRKNNLKTYKHTFIKRLITKNKKDFFKELHKINLYFDYNILTKSSLYEAIEYIIYAFKLSKKSNNSFPEHSIILDTRLFSVCVGSFHPCFAKLARC